MQQKFYPIDKFFVEFVKNSEKYNMPQHYHNAYEIYLQVHGERYFFLDDICHILKPGDMYILRPFAIHYTESREFDYYERYVMNLSLDTLSFFLSENEQRLLSEKLESCIIHLNPAQMDTVLHEYKRIHELSAKNGFLAGKQLYTAAFQLLMHVKELAETTEVVPSQNVQSEIVSAIHYINKHYNEQISLDMVADMVHLSKYHFCRLFHSATGATFLDYIYNVRLSKVHKMLLETDLSINDIAIRCGFTSTAHLTRIFRRIYNISPRDFRKNAASASITPITASQAPQQY